MSLTDIFGGPYALLAKWGVIAALALSLTAFGWFKGNEHGTQKLYDYQGKEAIATVKLGKVITQLVTKTEIEYRTKIEKIYIQGETIEKEVTKYVTKDDDIKYAVPNGFVRNFNAIWSNTIASPPVESDREPSGIPLSEVSGTEAGNAKSCHIYKKQRDGLIVFYNNLRETVNGK